MAKFDKLVYILLAFTVLLSACSPAQVEYQLFLAAETASAFVLPRAFSLPDTGQPAEGPFHTPASPPVTLTPFLPATTTPAPTLTPTITRDPSLITVPGYGDFYPSELHLPDLETLPPYDLRYVVNNATGYRQVRFSNAVWNKGAGDLELFGEMDDTGHTISVVQQISTTFGLPLDVPIGEFLFHNQHDHWHWEGFSTYEVWSVHQNGSLDSLQATAGKVSYCVRDNVPATQFFTQMDSLPGTPRYRTFTSCFWEHQGLSVGWVDIYQESLAGQYVDISHLADGSYALVSIADPGNRIIEVDETNNTAIVYFNISGSRLQRVDPGP